MSMKQIDCYGFETTSEYFKLKKLDAHLVKIKDGVMYMCFGDEPQRPIAPACAPPLRVGSRFARRSPPKAAARLSAAHSRIDKDGDGSLRIMWAYGAWADAETLSYIPINETMNLTLKED